MSNNDIEQVRLLEHAFESAVGGLGREEWLELRRQVGAAALDQDDSLERAAAAIDLARQPKLEPMPRSVSVAVADAADRFFAPRRTPSLPRAPLARPAWFVYGGWIAAAASLVASAGLVLQDRPDTGGTAAPVVADAGSGPGQLGSIEAGAGAREAAGSAAAGASAASAGPGERLAQDGGGAASGGGSEDEDLDAAGQRRALAARRFVLQRNWAPAGDAVGREVRGDVVWDARTQTGYMRFVGLRRNDPATEQYQLWIFDKNQSDKTPIDGGVFDIASTEEVIVPINAKLQVQEPFMFAVTIEKPGGVVMSSRERLPLLAKVE